VKKLMSLPDVIRVKLSSEAAESISLTPVVVREMPLRELVEYMLGVTGKDASRICELLRRGTLVSGASRFRWSGWEADRDAVLDLLASFPDPEPLRPLAAERCTRAILRGGRLAIEIPREAGKRKPLLRRGNFWNMLLEVVGGSETRYHTYSYKDRADIYQIDLGVESVGKLRSAARLLTYSSLRERIEGEGFTMVELYVERG
jgi:hypothetical protein